jgi:hypothetical protein
MEEGEKLSKRQMDMEQAGRAVRAKLAEADADKEQLAARVAAEEARAEGLARTKQRLERDADAAAESHRAELAAQKEQYDSLLAKARAEQVGEQRNGSIDGGGVWSWRGGREGRCRLLRWLLHRACNAGKPLQQLVPTPPSNPR